MIEISNTAKATMGFRRQVHAKTDGRCFYCGVHVRCGAEELPRDWLLVRGGGVAMVPDHAYPKARGGSDTVDNRLPACGGCNAAKGWLTVEEFRFLKGLRAGDLSFRFPAEEPARPRDWLCVHSGERDLFAHNFPWARESYSRGRSLRERTKTRGVTPQ
jgi:hypothetical protein